MRRQTQFFEQWKDFRVKIDVGAFDGARPIKNHPERTLRRHVGIEMLERTRGGVTRIGEQRQSGRFSLFVQFLKAGFVQISFPADFENSWRRAAQLMRHRSDRFDVLGNVVAD